MEIKEIKEKMKFYKDFYGGDLLGIDEIDDCKTKFALEQILSKHEKHMEMMLSDAMNHIIGLY